MYKSSKAISAFSLDDYEELSNFGRGKDKKPRKKRSFGNLRNPEKKDRDIGLKKSNKKASNSFFDDISNSFDRAVNAGKAGYKKGFQSNKSKKVVEAYTEKLKDGTKKKGFKVTKKGKDFEKWRDASGNIKTKNGNVVEGVKKGVEGVWKSGKVGKAGIIGAGALGAAGVAGGGYAAYKAMKNRQNKDDE